jgi:hypothetical protein
MRGLKERRNPGAAPGQTVDTARLSHLEGGALAIRIRVIAALRGGILSIRVCVTRSFHAGILTNVVDAVVSAITAARNGAAIRPHEVVLALIVAPNPVAALVQQAMMV